MEEKRLSFMQKVGYGIGDFGSNYCWTFVASFVLLYFTNVLGLNAAVIGTLMMISKVLDGFTDVIMGSIIDKTRSRMGKAMFWYFWSSFPTAFCVFLIFNIPASFNENTKYAYIFIIYTLMGAVFYTMNNIAYSTLTALVTKNAKDRVSLGSYRFIFAIIGVLTLSSFTSGLVDYFGGGQQGWRIVSIIYAVICLVTLLIPVIAVKELPESELESEKKKASETEKIGFAKTIMMLFKNKYFVMILLYYLFMYLSSGITQGLGIYYTTYCLKNAGLLGAISMAGMLPIVFILPIVPALSEKYGIRKISIVGGVIGVIGAIIAYVGGIVGVIPALMIGLVVIAIGKAPLTGSLNALIAATDDYSLLKLGRRMTGTIYSCSSVGIKIGTGLGTAACGFILEWGGFDGMAETQSAGALATISQSYLIATVLVVVAAIVLLLFLNVEEENKKLRQSVDK